MTDETICACKDCNFGIESLPVMLISVSRSSKETPQFRRLDRAPCQYPGLLRQRRQHNEYSLQA